MVYPQAPLDMLRCPDEPKPGQIILDVQLAEYLEAVRIAGESCRLRLGYIRKWVEGWQRQ